jgi:hypothetical protein
MRGLESKSCFIASEADWRAGRMKLPDLDNEEFVPLPKDAVKQERLP